MSLLTLSNHKAPEPASAAWQSSNDLETIIKRLGGYGRPTLTAMETGKWWCYVKLNVTAVGAAFEVQSDSNAITPVAAAKQCEERMHAALRKIGPL